jgi:hypothetical protein
MPRYYFALSDGDLSLADDEVGEELDHMEAARRARYGSGPRIVASPAVGRPHWALHFGS